MNKQALFISMAIYLLSPVQILAVPATLTLECYSSPELPTVSTIINVPDLNDQLEISHQAMLFALSPSGWNLSNFGFNTPSTPYGIGGWSSR